MFELRPSPMQKLSKNRFLHRGFPSIVSETVVYRQPNKFKYLTMKKILTIAFLLLSFFYLQAQDKKLVVATASMIADMAENIAGGEVDIKMIVPIGGDPHLYEPTPKDAQLVNGADLVLMNGLTFEGWLTELVENSGTKASTVLVTKGIQPIESATYKNSADPHAWMDAELGLMYIQNIKEALVALAPEHAETFEFNYGVYKKQLIELDQYIQSKIQTIPVNQRVLITSHDAFQYYGQKYGIRLEAILGTSTDAEVQTSDVMRLNKVIKESGVPAVFVESTVNPKLLKQLAQDNDIEIGGELYADSIGDKDSPASSYIDMLKYNTDVIVKALSTTKTSATSAASSDKKNTGLNKWVLIIGAVALLIGFLIGARLRKG